MYLVWRERFPERLSVLELKLQRRENHRELEMKKTIQREAIKELDKVHSEKRAQKS